MNPNQPFPEDREPLGDDSVDAQRLATIEQRLKSARPRPAALDIEAIVRKANGVDQTVELPDRSAAQRGTRPYR